MAAILKDQSNKPISADGREARRLGWRGAVWASYAGALDRPDITRRRRYSYRRQQRTRVAVGVPNERRREVISMEIYDRVETLTLTASVYTPCIRSPPAKRGQRRSKPRHSVIPLTFRSRGRRRYRTLPHSFRSRSHWKPYPSASRSDGQRSPSPRPAWRPGLSPAGRAWRTACVTPASTHASQSPRPSPEDCEKPMPPQWALH